MSSAEMSEQVIEVNDTVAETTTEETKTKKPRGRPRNPPPPPKPPKMGPQSLYLTDRTAYHRKYYAEKVRRLTCCQICNKTLQYRIFVKKTPSEQQDLYVDQADGKAGGVAKGREANSSGDGFLMSHGTPLFCRMCFTRFF